MSPVFIRCAATGMDPLAKRVAARFQTSHEKRASIEDGPIGRALTKYWNQVHDLEYDLQHTIKDYDDAAHFMGGPAEHDAKEMIKRIQAVHKELEHLTMHTFSEIVDAEGKFVAKHGEPSKYADDMRKKVFPRAAAQEAAQQNLDPTKPLDGNAVAYFTVGGDENEGDPESVALSKGHIPVQEVVKYLHKRMPGAKVQPGHHPGEIVVHDIGWDKKPYSYTTKVKVKSRK